jgi:hypothetical protein
MWLWNRRGFCNYRETENYATKLFNFFTRKIMKNFKSLIGTLMLFAFALLFAFPAKACDRSNLTLLGVTPLAGGQYSLDLRFCVGAGRTGTQYGAGNDTWVFGFFLSNNSEFAGCPSQIVSPQTGHAYLDTIAGGDTLVYYPASFFTGGYEPWACINNCGGIQTVCYDITLITTSLPDSLWMGGAEGGGNIRAGCTGTEMTVYPKSFGCNIVHNGAVTQPICPGSTGSITCNPAGGIAPYTFLWSNGATTASISGLAPGTYGVTIADASANCTKTGSFTVTAPATYTINLGADKTVYRGYSPQSCTALAPARVGGVGPFTYAWSTGSSSSSINVCPTTTTTYSVTVTDSRGCAVTDDVVVNVIDVRCGNGNSKVLVCHNGSTLCVTSAQATAHLGHGDVLGNCANKSANPDLGTGAVPMEFKLSAYPVPARETIHFDVLSPEEGTLTLEVFDLQGKRITVQPNIAVEAGSLQELTVEVAQWTPGMYIARVNHSNSGVQTMKFTVVK